MPGPVTLDLREGFEADEVTVHATGAADIELHAVKTRMQVGLARSLPLALPHDTARIEIELPHRGVRTSIELLPGRPLWVGASLSRDGQRLEVEQRLEPFRYA